MHSDLAERLNIPTAYLEGYPFPAFAVTLGGSEYPELVWGNRSWRGLCGDAALRDVLEITVLERLTSWLDGNDEEVFHLDTPTTSLRLVKAILPSSTSNTAYILTSLNPGCPRSGPQSTLTSKSLNCRGLLDTYDWAQTSLGPRSTWSPVMETMLAVILASPTQDALWLGPEFLMLYNDHYAQIVDHPKMFGKSAMRQDAWGPVWEGVQHLIDLCLTQGQPCHLENDLLLYRRGPTGHYVERYHTWSFIPLFDNGKPIGLFNPTVETTAAVLAKRRQETMRDLSEQMSAASTKREFFDGIAEVMERNTKDVPFVACYRVEDHGTSWDLERESLVGVPSDHPSCPRRIAINVGQKLRRSGSRGSSVASPSLSGSYPGSARVSITDESHSWPIKKALITRQCVIVENCSRLIQGFPLRQWDELPVAAIVVPICAESTTETPGAVLILGLNLLCPLDAQYEDWIQLIRAHLTSSLAAVCVAEDEQQRLADEERMNRAKTAWFQNAAHDLRSPLTLVAGPLDDILRTVLTPHQRTMLTMAQRNVSRIQRLVNALLDFSRIEAGKLQGRFVPLDLHHFVDELATLFKPAAIRRKIKFTIDLEPYDGVVFADPTLLETVVTNLLSNAVKYTFRGEIEVTLKYTTFAEISVRDTGCGIPEGELHSVANRYNRASTAISSGAEGTGIGLALSKEIVRLHGGDLVIQSSTSESDHGSTFTARLPLTQGITSDDTISSYNVGTYGRQLIEEAMHNSTPSDIDEESLNGSLNGMSTAEGMLFDPSDTLLLVDDNRELRSYIRGIFAPFCTVIEASNGKEALELARTRLPNLILSDLMMPVMNGEELLCAIREDKTTALIPMILLSAATDDELRVSALVKGAEDFLLKPFKPKELLTRVNLHVQLGKKRKHLEDMFALREKEIAILSDYCPSGILRADANGKLTYVNTAWRNQIGVGPEVDPDTWPDHLGSDRDALCEAWEEVVHGDTKETEINYQWINGRHISAKLVRLDKVDPGLTGVLGCMQDVTDQEERLHEAERRRLEAEESKRQQELLVDITSHEIRTPVSAILQCSSLVKENLVTLRSAFGAGPISPSAELLKELGEDIDALESIYQCGLVQERIAGDVLSFAQVQLDMLSIHDIDVDIRSEAQKIISVFASEVKMKQIELRLELGESLNILQTGVVSTDAVRVRQVVSNLVTNAIRFTATSPTRIITVRLDAASVPPADDTCEMPANRPNQQVLPGQPIWLFISVTDTGPGLSEREQSVLFKQFSQGSKMIHSRFGGSGLGLYICRKISELLGGKIECHSHLGQGSVFRFFIQARQGSTLLPIPTNPGPQTTLPQIQNGHFPAPQSPLSPKGKGTKRAKDSLHILIVEDNIINQTVLKRQIIKAGWTCDVASNGQEALDLIHLSRTKAVENKEAVYDAVLMDLEMPIMDGLTAIGIIRAEEAEYLLPRQLVVALTGNARDEQVAQALASGMDDVIIKPYKLAELQNKLRQAAGKA